MLAGSWKGMLSLSGGSGGNDRVYPPENKSNGSLESRSIRLTTSERPFARESAISTKQLDSLTITPPPPLATDTLNLTGDFGWAMNKAVEEKIQFKVFDSDSLICGQSKKRWKVL